ncbi:MAG: GAF domain-containing protein [Persicimonas sp.]
MPSRHTSRPDRQPTGEGVRPQDSSRIEALARVSRLAYEGHIEAVIDESLSVLRDELGADSARLFEWDARSRTVRLRAESREGPPTLGSDAVPLEESSAAARVIPEDGPPAVVVVDFDDEADAGRLLPFDEQKLRSGIDARISGGDGAWGILSVRSRHPGAFEAADTAFASAVANTIATVTASAQHRRQLREALSVCRKSAEARDESLSMISHDLRGPASAVKLGLEVVRRAVSGDLRDVSHDKLEEAIETANSNLDRMLDLVDDLSLGGDESKRETEAGKKDRTRPSE